MYNKDYFLTIMHISRFYIKFLLYLQQKYQFQKIAVITGSYVTVVFCVIRLYLVSVASWLPTFTLVLSLEKMPWLM